MTTLASPPRRFGAIFQKYWAIFKIQVVNSLAYPAEFVWRSMAILLFLWVFTYLWRVAYGNSGTTEMAGLTLANTLWYLMLAEAIELSRPRFAVTIAQAVKDGSIAYLLSKPYDFLLYQLSVNAGDSVFRMILTTLFGSALVWFMAGPPPDPRGWPLTIIAVIGGWLINFCLTALIGLLAFITEEVAPFMWIYQKFIFILGGMMIPLDFYPPWLQTISKATPFAYIMYGPARLFVTPSLARFFNLITGQLIWIAILGLLLTFVYRQGIRRLAINGG
jgi:ABC-2 type transport system permease protein